VAIYQREPVIGAVANAGTVLPSIDLLRMNDDSLDGIPADGIPAEGFDSGTYAVSPLGGHVLGLLESGLLPNIITGSSTGGFVAAFVCTRTDEELLETMQPKVLP
jgi:hypothetical protein